MSPPLNGRVQSQPADQLGVGMVMGSAGKRMVALVVNGKTIPLDQAQAQQLGLAMLGTNAVASLGAEDMRKMLLAAETGLVLPGGGS